MLQNRNRILELFFLHVLVGTGTQVLNLTETLQTKYGVFFKLLERGVVPKLFGRVGQIDRLIEQTFGQTPADFVDDAGPGLLL